MATVKEIEQFALRLSPEQKKRLERLARGAGLSANQYIALLIDNQYESESDTLEQIEKLRGRLSNPPVVAKKNHVRAA